MFLGVASMCCAQDFVRVPTEQVSHRDSVRLAFKPQPMRAVWMGAIVPGFGQIYNQSYWKLPIVYAAFFGSAYGIIYTDGLYSDYRTAYRDLYDDIQSGAVEQNNPEKTYIAILPDGYDLAAVGGPSKWQTTLKNYENNYRRYRDFSVVAAVLVYALSLIDAYVDAQLFDFEVSADLSMKVQPAINHDFMNNPSAEMHVAFTF